MVDTDLVEVERLLTGDQLGCPICSGVLAPWGHGRARQIRGSGGLTSWLQPRRSRCGDCRATHVLLPMSVLVRRADCVDVIGAALGLMAAGAGHRKIGTVLDVAAGTVRGWLRRFASRAPEWRVIFTELVVSLDPMSTPIRVRDSVVGDVVEVIGLAAAAAARRFGRKPPWQFASGVSGGLLLGPVPAVVPAVVPAG